jgi:hypothetical protein
VLEDIVLVCRPWPEFVVLAHALLHTWRFPMTVAQMLSRFAVALAFVMAVPAGDTHAQDATPATGAWFEQPLVAWNQPGAEIPQTTQNPNANPRCGGEQRWVENAEDQALVDAGWSLYGAYRSGWGLTVVDAGSGYDGMCRPTGFQSFVFVDGVFAGTISPEAMNPRVTGAGTVTTIGNGAISARFLRYAPTDPLCCPSLPAVDVTYQVDSTPNGPVLTPLRAVAERP